MTANIATMAYIAAIILFILSLGGLSNPETSRRGNLYGMVGMAIAALTLTAVNMFGGFAVTRRMLAMFRK